MQTKPRKQLPDQEIAELYLEGLSIADLARRYGVSTSTIHRRLHEQEIQTRSCRPPQPWAQAHAIGHRPLPPRS